MQQEIIEVDLDEVKEFIENPEFHQYLLANTTEFSTAAFILQTLLDAVENAIQRIDNTENI